MDAGGLAVRRKVRVDGIVRAASGDNAPMHLVILAWLFVIFTMALTMTSALAGIAFFVALGLGPVLLYFAISVRRARAARARAAIDSFPVAHEPGASVRPGRSASGGCVDGGVTVRHFARVRGSAANRPGHARRSTARRWKAPGSVDGIRVFASNGTRGYGDR